MHRKHNRIYKPGDKTPASLINDLNKEIARLGNIRGAEGSGIEVRSGPGGITIGADIQTTADRRLAIAVKEGDPNGTEWPSFLDWTEADGNAAEQTTIFDFQFVEPSSLYDPELDRPTYYFPYTETGEYVRALNVTEHYVPHYLGYAGYVQWLTKIGGKWFAEYSLPPIIRVHLLGDLYPDGDCLANTTNYELGNPQFRVYDAGIVPTSKKWSAGALGLARLQRYYSQFLNSPMWRYEVYEIFGCPAFDDTPEEP